ncbi:RloB family protein [Patescibacteria group bacterium]|nr:RloB family protein [Patescibacteria group bacterium]MBU4580490.1 RloB family protein [Patescibacteria group bacterium]
MNRNQNSRFNRKYNTRNEYKIIYIFTEGEKTEVNYFESKKLEIEAEIRRRNIKIEIKGTGHNTLSIVEYALDFIDKENIEINGSADSDECWVVFDKDSFDKDFDSAINKAKASNIGVAYSNESFELWFLLHFNLLSSALSRELIKEKLGDVLQKKYSEKYEKKKENMHFLIKDLEETAIKNAKYLIKMHECEKSYLKKNPSTTVYLLVENLNKLKQ